MDGGHGRGYMGPTPMVTVWAHGSRFNLLPWSWWLVVVNLKPSRRYWDKENQILQIKLFDKRKPVFLFTCFHMNSIKL